MTENNVNPPINNDPMEKRNEFIDHPSYVQVKRNPYMIIGWSLPFHFSSGKKNKHVDAIKIVAMTGE